LLGMTSIAIGSVYPVATVSIQNAVPHHQVGVAMGAMNFFRALASAFAVAAMGAIVLAGFGVAPERGTRVSASMMAATVGGIGERAEHVFSMVFLAGAVCLALALAAVVAMEERPLRGATSSSRVPAAAGDPASAPAE